MVGTSAGKRRRRKGGFKFEWTTAAVKKNFGYNSTLTIRIVIIVSVNSSPIHRDLSSDLVSLCLVHALNSVH